MQHDSLGRNVRDFVKGLRLWRVWAFMALRDIHSRYQRSIIGPFWVAGAMAVTAIALSFVFGGIFGQPLEVAIPYIMSGLVVWQLAALAFLEGPDLFISQAGTLHNNAFPSSFYVFRFLLRALVVAGHNVVVLAITLVAVGIDAMPTWQVIPGVVLVTFFALFASALVGMVAARFRDLRFMIPQVGQLLFFLTPVFWRVSDVPDHRSAIYILNPMYYLIEIVRTPILGGLVEPSVWIAAVLIVGSAGFLYFTWYAAYRRRLSFWV